MQLIANVAIFISVLISQILIEQHEVLARMLNPGIIILQKAEVKNNGNQKNQTFDDPYRLGTLANNHRIL
jgi:hypothetical protein